MANDDDVAPTLPPSITPDLAATARPDTKPASAAAFTQPPLADGLYETEQEIGRGGMGRVVAARDRRLDRVVALKLLQTQSPEIALRFKREAEISARLQHPGIVPIYEAGRLPNGDPFYAMKLVSGQPLERLVDKARTMPARLALLPNLIAVADALAYAHDRQIVHRDLKPQNVIVGDFGETVVIDWGLAKSLRDDPASEPSTSARDTGDTALTMHGAVMGTPMYMAPEQARGEVVDERADVFAIGAMLYQVLAGRTVYTGRSVNEVLARAQVGEAAPSLPADVPADLAAIVMKALAPERADRYRSAKELAADLHSFQAGQLVGVHRYSLRELIGRWIRKHRGVVAVATIAILAVAVLSAIGIMKIRSERAEATRQRDVARAERAQASELSLTMLVDQGRRELVSGQAARALPFAARVAELAPERTEVRVLASEAARAVGDAVFTAMLSDNAKIAFAPDGRRAVAVERTADGKTKITTIDLVAARITGTATLDMPFNLVDPPAVDFATTSRFVVTSFDTTGAEPQGTFIAFDDDARELGRVSRPGWRGVVLEGTTLALTGTDLELWDMTTSALRQRIEHGLTDARGFRVDGGFIVVGKHGSGERALRIDLAAGTVTSKVDVPEVVVQVRSAGLLVEEKGKVRVVPQSGPARTLPAAAVRAVDRAMQRAVLDVRYGETVVSELWDLSTGALIKSLDVLRSAAFSPDGTRLVAADSHGMRLVDTASGRMLGWVARQECAATERTAGCQIVFAPSGKRFAISHDASIAVHDAASGARVATVDAAIGNVRALVFASDTRLALETAAARGALRIVELPAEPMVRYVGAHGLGPVGESEVAPAVASDHIALAGRESVLVIDTKAGTTTELAVPPVRVSGPKFGIAAVAIDSKGGVIAGTPAGVVRVDSSGVTLIAKLPYGAVGFDLSRDRTRLVATGVSGDVVAIDLRDGTAKPLGTARGESSRIPHARISPDGTLALIATGVRPQPEVQLVETATGRVVRKLAGSAAPSALAFDPSGARVAIGFGDGTIALANVTGDAPPHVLGGRESAVVSLAFDRDGTRIAATAGRAITIFDLQTNTASARCDGGGDLDGVAFSPAGDLLASSTYDAVQLRDRSCNLLAVLPGVGSAKVAFTGDGHHLIAGGPEGWMSWRVPAQVPAQSVLAARLATVPWQLVDGRLLVRELPSLGK